MRKFLKTLTDNPMMLIIMSGALLLVAAAIVLIALAMTNPDIKKKFTGETSMNDQSDMTISNDDIDTSGDNASGIDPDGSGGGTASSGGKSQSGSKSGSGSYDGTSLPADAGKDIDTDIVPDSKPVITLRTTKIPGFEKVITECSVTDFGAVADGKTEVTACFQNALNYMSELGGGVIWVPAGKYYFEYTLNIPKSCYLLGEWSNPDSEPGKISNGTVFLCTADKGIDTDTKPFIALGTGAGVVGITIYYPNQSATNPVKYPPTFMSRDAVEGRSGYPTIRYTTIVNPYKGVNFGPGGNELAYIDHLYMSPLYRGVFINLSTDISRIEHMYISSKYYAAYDKNVNQSALASKMKSTVTGMRIQRSDWQALSYSTISDCQIALKLEKQDPVTNPPVNGANLELYNLTIDNCDVGFYYEFNETNHQLTKMNISTDNECFKFASGFNGSVNISTATLKSKNANCILSSSGDAGAVAIMDSTFTGWGSGKNAVEAQNGGLVVDNCNASSAGTIKIGSGVNGATTNRLSNLTVSNGIGGNAGIGTAAYSAVNLVNLPTLPVSPVASGGKLVTVISKGAAPDGSKDSTAAFQAAIDDVKKAGGGIAYIPAGKYLINGTLNIPNGVELRGVSMGPHHSSAMGSVLFTTAGEGNESGQAFITVNEGAGIRGFLVWYPNQKYDSPKKYPWTISAKAKNVWVTDVTIAGGWNGLLLGNGSGGHIVTGLTGFNFKTDIKLDGSNSRGYMINCHFNPHFYGRALVSELPGTGCMFNSDTFSQFLGLIDGMKESFIMGSSVDEVMFSAFNYRARIGLTMTNGFNGILKGCGFDATIIGIKATGGKAILINFLSDCVPANTQYLDMTAGDFKFINAGFSAFNWSPGETHTGAGMNIKGGTVDIRLLCFNASTVPAAINVSGGTVTAGGMTFRHYGASKGSGSATVFGDQGKGVQDIAKTGGSLTVFSGVARGFANVQSEFVNNCKKY